jgi:hypothetical protein
LSLKRTDPDKYSSIFQLEAHNEERKKTGRSDLYYLEITFASNVDSFCVKIKDSLGKIKLFLQ